MTKPTIRVLRHMARSGGTVISKCLAVMDSVALLSEIHPLGQQQFNPVRQALEWHGLVNMADVTRWQRLRPPMGFGRAIAEIEARARERGRTLIIREWSHLDVIGRPYCQPTGRFLLGEALAPRFKIAQAITVRHPVDQYLSLARLEVVQGMGVPEYLRGCRVFAEWAHAEGFVRYEDFTRDPDAALTDICARLRMPFDTTYRQRWATYDKITGDVAKQNAGRGVAEAEIRSLPRRETPPGLLEEFRRSDDYHRTIELLGYDDA